MSETEQRQRGPCALHLPYDSIIKSRQGKCGMALDKHTAADAACCERIIRQLGKAGISEECDWAIWMLWWRTMDWKTQQQIQEMQQETICQLRERIDLLERQKRGAGPEVQYA